MSSRVHDRAAAPSPHRGPVRHGALHDLLERVTSSRLNYRASYAADFAVPVILGYLGWRAGLDSGKALMSLCAGAFAFSFIEYAIHRWLFHSSTCFIGALHDAHHHAPVEATALPCITSAVVALAFWTVMYPIAGAGVTSFFLAGVMIGYFWYAVMHHLEHHISIHSLPWRWLQRRWARHSVHHRLPHTNFGVTTSLWDRLLGTHYQATRRRRSCVS
jgi:sterol desaturase/sphingolipid hydroxylase (fatty acid hydroxylase superfamily)